MMVNGWRYRVKILGNVETDQMHAEELLEDIKHRLCHLKLTKILEVEVEDLGSGKVVRQRKKEQGKQPSASSHVFG